jgi:hypothetical protein
MRGRNAATNGFSALVRQRHSVIFDVTALIRSFAALLAPGLGNDARPRQWIADARAADLPHVHSFTRGLDLDIQAATATLTMPHHNGRTEGVNTRTKMIKEQMYGRAKPDLLRKRVLLAD